MTDIRLGIIVRHVKRIHLRTAREKKDLTQQQLAAKLGWRQSRISALETTIEHPRYEVVLAIAGELDVNPSALTFGAQEAATR